jgi:hypothetical protein
MNSGYQLTVRLSLCQPLQGKGDKNEKDVLFTTLCVGIGFLGKRDIVSRYMFGRF